MKLNVIWSNVALLFALLIVSLLAIFHWSVPTAMAAPTPNELTGYAWSSNIGWISMNCANTGTCAASNYKVTIDQTTGRLTGYAWSSNIGWISFGDPNNVYNGYELSGFPGAGGLPTLVPDGTGTGYNLVGWIRACAGTINGDCSTMNDHPDGWDGWISLSGTATDGSSYGIHLDNTGVVGNSNSEHFAWGDDVVGWVSFKDSVNGFYEVHVPVLLPDLQVGPPPTYIESNFDPTTGEHDLTINYNVYNSGTGLVTKDFTSTFTLDGGVSVTDTVRTTDWGGAYAAGSVTFANVPLGPHTIHYNFDSGFDIDEVDDTNNEGNWSHTIPIPDPGLILKIMPGKLVRYNSALQLDWDLNGVGYLNRCTIDGPNLASDYAVYTNGDALTGSVPNVGPVKSKSIYLLRCYATMVNPDDTVFSTTATVETTGTIQEI